MKKTVFSGHQPNFLPYMGFFYKVAKSDVFVLDDDVQFTNRNNTSIDGVRVGHNSNSIREWDRRGKIAIPVSYDFGDKINEVRISYDGKWKDKLLKTIRCNYGKHPYFDEGYYLLEEALSMNYEKLYELNKYLLDWIIKGFGFPTRIVVASESVPTELVSNERNIFQCKALGGDVYYSGAGGREYNDEKAYAENGIELVYSDYVPVRYRQYHKKDFMENLSVIDYIFNCGYKIPEGWCEENGRG